MLPGIQRGSLAGTYQGSLGGVADAAFSLTAEKARKAGEERKGVPSAERWQQPAHHSPVRTQELRAFVATEFPRRPLLVPAAL